MSCADVRLDEYLDGELDAPARAAVDAHLAACAACRAELARSRSLEDVLRRAPEEGAPDPERFLAELRVRTADRPWRRRAALAAVLLVGVAAFLAFRPRPPRVDVASAVDAYAAKPSPDIEETLRLAGPAALAAVETRLGDPDVRVQVAAATLLFKLGDEAVRDRVTARFQPSKDPAWVLSDLGAEAEDAELVPIAVSALTDAGSQAWAIDVLRRLNRMHAAAREKVVDSVVTLLKSDMPEVQALALEIVRKIEIEFPLTAVVDLLDSRELGEKAREVLREAVGKDHGRDAAAWRRALKERKP